MTKWDADNLSAPHTQRELGVEPAPEVDVSTEAVMRLTAGLSLWIDRAEAAEAEVARLREALADALKEGMRIATCVPIEQVQEAFSAALRAIAEPGGR